MNNYQLGYTDATRGYIYRESLPSPAWRNEKMLRDYERGWQKGRAQRC